MVAIGAPGNDGSGNDAGHVRVYSFNSGTMMWEQKGQDIDGEAEGDQSGASVSLSSDGTMVAIGATSNDGSGSDAGHVRVYSFNSGTMMWEQKGQDIDGEAADDRSGTSVSLSSDGTMMAIGALGNDGSGSDAGHVRVYSFNSGTMRWEQKGQDIDGEAAGDFLGFSVSLSSDGTMMAIGAPSNDGSGNGAGHVRVYSFNSGTMRWEQKGQDIDGEAAGDFLGFSVSLSSDGTMMAIGAPSNDGSGNGAGHVRVYSFNNGTMRWEQKGQDVDGEAVGDFSGASVSLSSDGTMVAIGAPENDGSGARAGHVRVYSFCTIMGISATTPTCNGNDATFNVAFSASGGTGTIEVLDGTTVVGSGASSPIAVTIAGPTTVSSKTLTVRYQNNTACSGTVNVNIPFCKTPGIADPCSCEDPLKKRTSNGLITHFHDVLTVSGAANTAVVLVTGGANFLDNNLVQIANNTPLGNIPADGSDLTYDFFHASGASGSIVLSVGGTTLAPLAISVCDAAVCSTVK